MAFCGGTPWTEVVWHAEHVWVVCSKLLFGREEGTFYPKAAKAEQPGCVDIFEVSFYVYTLKNIIAFHSWLLKEFPAECAAVKFDFFAIPQAPGLRPLPFHLSTMINAGRASRNERGALPRYGPDGTKWPREAVLKYFQDNGAASAAELAWVLDYTPDALIAPGGPRAVVPPPGAAYVAGQIALMKGVLLQLRQPTHDIPVPPLAEAVDGARLVQTYPPPNSYPNIVWLASEAHHAFTTLAHVDAKQVTLSQQFLTPVRHAIGDVIIDVYEADRLRSLWKQLEFMLKGASGASFVGPMPDIAAITPFALPLSVIVKAERTVAELKPQLSAVEAGLRWPPAAVLAHYRIATTADALACLPARCSVGVIALFRARLSDFGLLVPDVPFPPVDQAFPVEAPEPAAVPAPRPDAALPGGSGRGRFFDGEDAMDVASEGADAGVGDGAGQHDGRRGAQRVVYAADRTTAEELHRIYSAPVVSAVFAALKAEGPPPSHPRPPGRPDPADNPDQAPSAPAPEQAATPEQATTNHPSAPVDQARAAAAPSVHTREVPVGGSASGPPDDNDKRVVRSNSFCSPCNLF